MTDGIHDNGIGFNIDNSKTNANDTMTLNMVCNLQPT